VHAVLTIGIDVRLPPQGTLHVLILCHVLTSSAASVLHLRVLLLLQLKVTILDVSTCTVELQQWFLWCWYSCACLYAGQSAC
jgi:hypothetical protein